METAICAGTGEGMTKGKGSDNLRENGFGEAIDAIVRFAKLKTGNKYIQEIVISSQAHNQSD